MSEELVQKLMLKMQSMRQDIVSMKVAMVGDEKMGIDGMKQHIDSIVHDVDLLKKDVRGLKNDRVKVVAWVSGIAAGCSVAGTKLVDWFRS